jgi:hypothetical protein
MQYPVGKPGCWNPHNPNCTSPANDPQCVCSPKGEYPGGGGACAETDDFLSFSGRETMFAKTGLEQTQGNSFDKRDRFGQAFHTAVAASTRLELRLRI